MTFYRQQHLFQVRSQPPCSGKFACLESRPSLATCNRATVPVAKAKCYYCSSTCLQFCPVETSLYSKGGCARQLVSSCHRLKLLRNWDCAHQKVKLQNCRYPPVFPTWSTFVLRKLCFFWLLIWHFMASGTFVKFDAGHQAVVNLLVLRAALVLPLAIVPLFQLQKQSATTVLPSCACNSAHLRPDLYSKCGLQEPQLWDCYLGSEMVLDRDDV